MSVVLAGAALAQKGMEWMPEGGRALVLAAFGENPDRIAEIASMEHNAQEWRELVEQAGADLTEVQILTLSSYLALNLPLAEPASLADLEPASLAEALPPDGKDLAVKHCQACHPRPRQDRMDADIPIAVPPGDPDEPDRDRDVRPVFRAQYADVVRGCAGGVALLTTASPKP